MPTVRIHDTAGQVEHEQPVVDTQLGPPTMGDEEDEARREAAYGGTAAAPLEDLVEPEVKTANAGFSATQIKALERLRSLGSRRAALRTELDAVETELLGDAIVSAFKLKIPKRTIATESGVVRQTVYNVIERA